MPVQICPQTKILIDAAIVDEIEFLQSGGIGGSKLIVTLELIVEAAVGKGRIGEQFIVEQVVQL